MLVVTEDASNQRIIQHQGLAKVVKALEETSSRELDGGRRIHPRPAELGLAVDKYHVEEWLEQTVYRCKFRISCEAKIKAKSKAEWSSD